ncbi:hypothetical protein [Actinoplanes friuliensis]|uniref:Uncharacterized protein n=1 Tax=Actinoplanes friuliensis DSM 7358 TaxID=1246995 RepID=U5WAV0_9ACTN|nr:hypothetical protein [Actinoplanes friuliensis]AGZ46122.1 hypothetical protein AFR_39340 [Actinoplanes friuliensis DSM 7358]
MIRRHGKRPTIALWMLVAIADVALVMAAVGTLAVLFTVAVAAILAGGVLMLQRRTTPQQESILRRRA